MCISDSNGAGRSRNEGHSRLSAQLFERGLTAVMDFTSPRAWSFTLLGIHEYLRRFPGNESINAMRMTLTGRLVALWNACATEHWPWFEDSVTYENRCV